MALGGPGFESDYKVVLFDHVGAGGSGLSGYQPEKYASLACYAVVEIGRELGLAVATFVGHSVSAMIGALASLKAPEMFKRLVMVGPSPRYIDNGDYVGGFPAAQFEELLESLADNHMGWSAAMALAIMGNPDRPKLGQELADSFCRTDPDIARAFARVTFTSDNRSDLEKITSRTLILQCSDDSSPDAKSGSMSTRIFPPAGWFCSRLPDINPTSVRPTKSRRRSGPSCDRARRMSDGEPVEDLEDLYENAPCGYLMLRPDGTIAKSNGTLSTWIGFTAGQLAGKRSSIC